MFEDQLRELRKSGWSVELFDGARPLPQHMASRYPDLPPKISTFLMKIKSCVNPDQTAWLNGATDFDGSSDSAFRWNEFEMMTLDAAKSDPAWQQDIRSFWDRHLPLLLSVKAGYAYFAYKLGEPDSGAIVHGFEPQFEEATLEANSLEEFLAKVALAARGELEDSAIVAAV